MLDPLLRRRREVGPQLDDGRLGLEVPDLDARGRRRAEPVAVGRERQRRDRVPGVERVEPLALGEVPEPRDAVLAARGAERAVGRDGDGGDVAGVLDEVEAELAVGEVPDLDGRITGGRGREMRARGRGGEWKEWEWGEKKKK